MARPVIVYFTEEEAGAIVNAFFGKNKLIPYEQLEEAGVLRALEEIRSVMIYNDAIDGLIRDCGRG